MSGQRWPPRLPPVTTQPPPPRARWGAWIHGPVTSPWPEYIVYSDSILIRLKREVKLFTVAGRPGQSQGPLAQWLWCDLFWEGLYPWGQKFNSPPLQLLFLQPFHSLSPNFKSDWLVVMFTATFTATSEYHSQPIKFKTSLIWNAPATICSHLIHCEVFSPETWEIFSPENILIVSVE